MKQAHKLAFSTFVAAILSLLLVTILATSGEVDAQRASRARRTRGASRTKAASTKVVEAPASEQIAPDMDGLTWGMSPRQVFDHFQHKIEENYRPRIAKVMSGIEEDRLRTEMTDEIGRMRRGFIRFRGQATAWDTSFLSSEYTHNNQESMLEVRDAEGRNFYFFIQDRLWKWYRALDASAFPGANFEQFSEALQARFGRAATREGALAPGRPVTHWLEWQDPDTRLRAVEVPVYNFYSLVYEQKTTLAQLDQLRSNQATAAGGERTLVDSIIRTDEDPATEPGNDPNADVVDRITGNIRRRQDAPPPAETPRRR